MNTTIEINGHQITLDKDFVDKFEKTTCSDISTYIPTCIQCSFGTCNMNEILEKHSVAEVTDTIIQMMQADINMYSGLL